jgi:hypothetical protein
MNDPIQPLRAAVRLAARGNDPDALALAAGRLTGALIRQGNGSDDIESAMRAAAVYLYRDEELMAMGGALRLLGAFPRPVQIRILTYVRRRLSSRWQDLPSGED